MSAKVDAERKEEARQNAVAASRELHVKMGRVISLFEDGMSQAAIGAAVGWHPKTVKYYLQVLKLRRGIDSGGRWRDKL